MSETGVFSRLSDDLILNILSKLDDDPRNWARIACLSTKFSSLITTVCYQSKCSQSIPSVVSDLLPSSAGGGWGSLYKLSVCCPGLFHAGFTLDNSDSCGFEIRDLSRKRKIRGPIRSHLASGIRNLSREQGNKLLARRFKGDRLYICDWPGCVHVEEKRNYMVFRGVFRNFKESRVWGTISDRNKSKIDFECAFCASKQMWDLHSSFCLRRYSYHDDGEPVVRAFVCENGHVSGAWTIWPFYT